MSKTDSSAARLAAPPRKPEPKKAADRLDAIAAEIAWFSEASWTLRPEPSIWKRPVFDSTGPFTIIRRKAARFRMPRLLKSELLDRFVSPNPADPSKLTSLVVVAHPDDESIGAGSRLRHLGDAWIVEVTDGAPRDLDCARRHGFETREAYADARARELRRALKAAGVPEDRLINIGFVDGEASLRLAELCLRLTEIIDDLKPAVVVTHPYEGGHTDHDATAFAVHLACGVLRREGVKPPAILELASYHAAAGEKVVQEFLPHDAADREQRIVHLSAAERRLKQRVFDCFTSQREVLRQFSTHFERYRPAPRYVFTKPPHEGLLNYERYGHLDRGFRWREHAQEALRQLRMRRD